MNDFILVTNKETGRRSSIAIDYIKAIDELSDGTAYITRGEVVSANLKRSGSFGVYTEESFQEIIENICYKKTPPNKYSSERK